MSMWTNVYGAIKVYCTEPNFEELQIKTVIESLPEITGSEENAEIKYIRLDQIGGSYYIDGNRINEYPYYMVVISGALRDKYAEETITEVKDFLTLLGQRISIIGGVVKISDYSEKVILDAEDFSAENGENTENFWCGSWFREKLKSLDTKIN